LRCFVVFADHANFTRAAEELHISQPALHVKIQKLASGIGAPLYVKDGRGLQVTDLGRSVAQFARRVDGEIDRYLAELGAPPDELLVLAAGAGAHRWVTQGAVRMLIGRGQRLRLLTTDRDETVQVVRNGTAGVGVTVLGTRPPGIGKLELATYAQVAVIPTDHPLARERHLVLSDLSGWEIVMPPAGRPQREALQRATRKVGIELSIAAEAEGWAEMLHFVSLGVGICVVNGCVEPGPGMVVRPVEDLPSVTYSALFRTAEQHEPRVSRLLEALRASAP
jgi:DNA-binding transcriptional LysR family regulator